MYAAVPTTLHWSSLEHNGKKNSKLLKLKCVRFDRFVPNEANEEGRNAGVLCAPQINVFVRFSRMFAASDWLCSRTTDSIVPTCQTLFFAE